VYLVPTIGSASLNRTSCAVSRTTENVPGRLSVTCEPKDRITFFLHLVGECFHLRVCYANTEGDSVLDGFHVVLVLEELRRVEDWDEDGIVFEYVAVQ